MQAALQALVEKARGELAALSARPEFEAAKARFVGPNGELTAMMKQLGAAPKEQKPILGKLINQAKGELQGFLDAALARIEQGTYGYSEVSGRPIPRERLEAIPWATVLVEEKVGGIGRR